jgi:hypothetical protein
MEAHEDVKSHLQGKESQPVAGRGKLVNPGKCQVGARILQLSLRIKLQRVYKVDYSNVEISWDDGEANKSGGDEEVDMRK